MSELDEFGRHEVLDRASLLMQTWDSFILEHGYVQATPELAAAAQKAFDGLHDFYQLAGRLTLEGSPDDSFSRVVEGLADAEHHATHCSPRDTKEPYTCECGVRVVPGVGG
ncbi:MAG: hypothetical protein JHD15_07005 [Phenylobacterium sp.]|uniref:hypothetical protein n=1 Tax=Phenylobacterium sp. TaxID=1871053 RepID=UPI001A205A13|nr:hypothetical protein [Phenylobacterium sp.]MBJ7410101.1 hypothetical protein [Phenylobacterium sp.]